MNTFVSQNNSVVQNYMEQNTQLNKNIKKKQLQSNWKKNIAKFYRNKKLEISGRKK